MKLSSFAVPIPICVLLIYLNLGQSKLISEGRDSVVIRVKGSRDLVQKKGRLCLKSKQSTSMECIGSSPPTTPAQKSANRLRLRSEFLSLLLPWLYFMTTSVNIPNLPRFINWSINGGNADVTAASAAVYGTLSGIDAFFTFLVVNLVGCMSDSFGRRPFMLLSACGLGIAYTITLNARRPRMFYLAAMIDGLTSCMFSQAQSYVTDMNNRKDSADRQSISVVLGRFQGIAVGMAFIFGIPLGAVLGAKYSLKSPLYLSIAFCVVNAILIAFFLPEQNTLESISMDGIDSHSSNPNQRNKNRNNNSNKNSKDNGEDKNSFRSKLKRVKWENASPVGAARMLMRNKRLVVGSVAYLFLNIAQV
jgi:MFS family permease